MGPCPDRVMVEFFQYDRRDPHTVANFEAFVTEHIKLDWLVDFDRKACIGHAILTVVRQPGHNEKQAHLDASEMIIKAVSCDGVALHYSYDGAATIFGGCLKIDLPDETAPRYNLKIEYETGPGCSALQWLNKEQTFGKAYPFMFSQCQAIHARTMLPCQDTPVVKATYMATVKVKSPMTAVMSSNKREVVSSDGDWTTLYFAQTTPIPAYLIAIGAGALQSRLIGPRSSVWCEAEVLERAAWEFGQTEDFIKAAEDIVTPYVWERYDILLLPPSFPYGGMENPCLTFLTPSLLAGDRSLVNVVAHEIAHSWTGNLVTNSSWEHFWLNEGFTVFLENKIAGRIHGEAERHFQAHIGLTELMESVEEFGEDDNLTRLVPDLLETNPDDAFSRIPYEKGHTFLFYLEELVGGPTVFEPYLKAHIKHFTGKSLSTKEWKEFLLEFYRGTSAGTALEAVDWTAWLYGTGMPPHIPEYDKSLLHAAESISQKWVDGCPPKDDSLNFQDSLNPNQKLMCLELIDRRSAGKLPHQVLQVLDERYKLSESGNVEIAMKWFMLCLHNNYEPAYKAVAAFASQHGRMKYCRPILKTLFHCPGGRQLALDTFKEHREFYHPIAAKMIAKDLQLAA